MYDRLNPKSPYYDPSFPKPIKLGSGENPPVGWLEHEADDWISAQAAKSRPQHPQTGATA
ncbi:MAG: AlpA family phage regulatory protein [Methylococcaceae bacterium]|nr:MAG: AlpA family phage regulatory protein [Methylococcaceae bacterium]